MLFTCRKQTVCDSRKTKPTFNKWDVTYIFFFRFPWNRGTLWRCKIPCDLACMRSVPNQPYLIIMLCSDSLLLIWVLPQFDFVHEISVWFTCLIELNAQIEQVNNTIPFGLRLFFRRLPLPPFMIHSMVFPTMKILVFDHIVIVAPCIQTHRLIVELCATLNQFIFTSKVCV